MGEAYPCGSSTVLKIVVSSNIRNISQHVTSCIYACADLSKQLTALPHACDGLLALAKEFLSPRHWVLRRRRYLEDWKGCYRVTQNSVDGFQPVSLPTEGRILHENLVNRLCFAGSQDVPTSHGDFTICSNSLERCKVL